MSQYNENNKTNYPQCPVCQAACMNSVTRCEEGFCYGIVYGRVFDGTSIAKLLCQNHIDMMNTFYEITLMLAEESKKNSIKKETSEIVDMKKDTPRIVDKNSN